MSKLALGQETYILFDFSGIIDRLPPYQKHGDFLFNRHAKVTPVEF
jgi:hypothetical protein